VSSGPKGPSDHRSPVAKYEGAVKTPLTAKRPWRAAYFAAIHGHYLELSAAAIDWLRQQAQAELDAIQE
jgi:hypothetical protein